MNGDTRIGSEIAGYRIERLIGKGGMSAVYLAEHLALGRKVAFKILAHELSQEQAFRDRFVRESRLAASIDHPNIVPIYDAGEAEGLLFIAMRYVDGTDLRAYLREFGPLSAGKTASIMGQVASALDAAHARGLVHRDVKPGNVLMVSNVGVEASDHVYLADFGLTKHALSVSGMTATGQFVGTIDYVAPEQIRGESVDGRTDVYSLGCMLYECLTGNPPFARDMEVSVLYAQLEEVPPRATDRRPELEPGIDDVIGRAMAKRPEDRYARAGELAAAARAELGGGIGEQAVLPSAASVRLLPRRRRAAWMAAGATMLLAVAAVAVVLLTRGGSKAVFPTGPNTVAVIDPARNAVTNGVAVGQRPSGIAFGEGAVWAVNFDDQTVSRIDPRSGTEVARPGGVGAATGIATGEGAVWVAETFSDTVSVIDPGLNKVSGTVPVPGAYAVAVGGGSVWVTSDTEDEVFRIDPQTEQQNGPPIGVGKRPNGIAADDSAVWVANSLSGTVARIDPTTANIVAGKIAIPCQPDQVAIGAGAAWVTCGQANEVAKIDPSKNAVVLTQKVGGSPTGIAVTSDGVWVACSDAGQVWRLNPSDGRVVARIPVHGSPAGIAVVNGQIWVTVQAP
ncbi:MAG: serine/threonine-protein kinase [Actinomycetota bacterium]|nr:serine/threonine-protein kinase [Actinomycetota bacterium]